MLNLFIEPNIPIVPINIVELKASPTFWLWYIMSASADVIPSLCARIYPIVFLDGIVYEVKKDAKVVNKCFYTVLGVNMDGRKEILGIVVAVSAVP